MFKNARLFRLQEPFAATAAELETHLATRPARPCGPLETATLGWAPPLADGSDSALVHAVSGCFLFCARRQERLLPATVVAETLAERVAEIEDNQARNVGRAERQRLREAVVADLLPRAFTRSRRILAYVDTQSGWLVVDAASEKLAEELVSLLRETLGSLPATPPRPTAAPADQMTAWVSSGEGTGDLALGATCELRDPKNTQSVVRCRGQNLAGEEIAGHLRAGKQVVQLELEWLEHVTFVLAEDLALRRLRLADALTSELAEVDDEDPRARFDAELALLVLELRGLLERLTGIFGLAADAAPTDPVQHRAVATEGGGQATPTRALG